MYVEQIQIIKIDKFLQVGKLQIHLNQSFYICVFKFVYEGKLFPSCMPTNTMKNKINASKYEKIQSKRKGES